MLSRGQVFQLLNDLAYCLYEIWNESNDARRRRRYAITYTAVLKIWYLPFHGLIRQSLTSDTELTLTLATVGNVQRSACIHVCMGDS